MPCANYRIFGFPEKKLPDRFLVLVCSTGKDGKVQGIDFGVTVAVMKMD